MQQVTAERRARAGARPIGKKAISGPTGRARALLVAGVLRLRRAGDIWYIVAAAVVNVANFAFFGLVGHLLHPSGYGAVAALLNVVSVASIPLNAVQAAIVQEVVLQTRDGTPPAIRRAGGVFLVSSLAATAILAGASPLAARFFGLGTVIPVLLLALWFAPSVTSSLVDGVLIGTLRWRPIAVSLIAGAVVRVGLAAIIGMIDPGINGPIIATVLNAATTLGVVLWVFWKSDHPRGRPELRLPIRTVLPTVLALTGYSVLVAIDTLMARHILSPTVSGNYAAAVTIGRIALFLPMAITVVAFPRFVSDGGRGRRARRLLLIGLAGILSLGLVTAGLLTLGRHLVVDVLFGHRYTEAASLIGLLGVEGAILGAISLLTYFHLARRSLFSAAPAVATVTVVVISLLLRPDAIALARLMVAVSAILLVVMVAGALVGDARPAVTDAGADAASRSVPPNDPNRGLGRVREAQPSPAQHVRPG